MEDNGRMPLWTRGRQRVGLALGLAAGVLLISAAVLSAQSGKSYGPGRIWWDAGQADVLPWDEDYDNPDGQIRILNTSGAIHTADHPFFEALGTNGRACVTCHQPSNAMSVSVTSLRARWNETHGGDPVFAAIDGSNCPDLPQKAMSSHSLLLDRGLFRISLPWPPRTAIGVLIKPEFRIEIVRDSTGCNTSPVYGLNSPNPSVSVFRRPRVVANLRFVSDALMADAREPSLQAQAITAIMVHEQAKMHPTLEQLRQIVDFESQIYAAQVSDIRGGLLNGKNDPAALGPENVASGIAGRLSGNSDRFDVWRKPKGAGDLGVQLEFRASVARGSDVFFARTFHLTGSDLSTCASCHAEGKTRAMDIGTNNRPAANESAELPLFRITCDSMAPPHPLLGRVIYTQEPGRSLITGKCVDVGSIVMQQFRGLAARAPYFSNGSAKTLRDVVDFYSRRFDIAFTEREKQDLVNFLSVL
jgi:hypothetical protein